MASMFSSHTGVDLRSPTIFKLLPHLPGNGPGRKILKNGNTNAILSILGFY